MFKPLTTNHTLCTKQPKAAYKEPLITKHTMCAKEPLALKGACGSLFYATHCQTADDVARHKGIEDDNRHKTNSDTKIDSAVLCAVNVAAKHLNEHRKRVFFCAREQNEWCHKVVP